MNIRETIKEIHSSGDEFKIQANESTPLFPIFHILSMHFHKIIPILNFSHLQEVHFNLIFLLILVSFICIEP